MELVQPQDARISRPLSAQTLSSVADSVQSLGNDAVVHEDLGTRLLSNVWRAIRFGSSRPSSAQSVARSDSLISGHLGDEAASGAVRYAFMQLSLSSLDGTTEVGLEEKDLASFTALPVGKAGVVPEAAEVSMPVQEDLDVADGEKSVVTMASAEEALLDFCLVPQRPASARDRATVLAEASQDDRPSTSSARSVMRSDSFVSGHHEDELAANAVTSALRALYSRPASAVEVDRQVPPSPLAAWEPSVASEGRAESLLARSDIGVQQDRSSDAIKSVVTLDSAEEAMVDHCLGGMGDVQRPPAAEFRRTSLPPPEDVRRESRGMTSSRGSAVNSVMRSDSFISGHHEDDIAWSAVASAIRLISGEDASEIHDDRLVSSRSVATAASAATAGETRLEPVTIHAKEESSDGVRSVATLASLEEKILDHCLLSHELAASHHVGTVQASQGDGALDAGESRLSSHISVVRSESFMSGHHEDELARRAVWSALEAFTPPASEVAEDKQAVSAEVQEEAGVAAPEDLAALEPEASFDEDIGDGVESVITMASMEEALLDFCLGDAPDLDNAAQEEEPAEQEEEEVAVAESEKQSDHPASAVESLVPSQASLTVSNSVARSDSFNSGHHEDELARSALESALLAVATAESDIIPEEEEEPPAEEEEPVIEEEEPAVAEEDPPVTVEEEKQEEQPAAEEEQAEVVAEDEEGAEEEVAPELEAEATEEEEAEQQDEEEKPPEAELEVAEEVQPEEPLAEEEAAAAPEEEAEAAEPIVEAPVEEEKPAVEEAVAPVEEAKPAVAEPIVVEERKAEEPAEVAKQEEAPSADVIEVEALVEEEEEYEGDFVDMDASEQEEQEEQEEVPVAEAEETIEAPHDDEPEADVEEPEQEEEVAAEEEKVEEEEQKEEEEVPAEGEPAAADEEPAEKDEEAAEPVALPQTEEAVVEVESDLQTLGVTVADAVQVDEVRPPVAISTRVAKGVSKPASPEQTPPEEEAADLENLFDDSDEDEERMRFFKSSRRKNSMTPPIKKSATGKTDRSQEKTHQTAREVLAYYGSFGPTELVKMHGLKSKRRREYDGTRPLAVSLPHIPSGKSPQEKASIEAKRVARLTYHRVTSPPPIHAEWFKHEHELHGDPPERDHFQHFDPDMVEKRTTRQRDIYHQLPFPKEPPQAQRTGGFASPSHDTTKLPSSPAIMDMKRSKDQIPASALDTTAGGATRSPVTSKSSPALARPTHRKGAFRESASTGTLPSPGMLGSGRTPLGSSVPYSAALQLSAKLGQGPMANRSKLKPIRGHEVLQMLHAGALPSIISPPAT